MSTVPVKEAIRSALAGAWDTGAAAIRKPNSAFSPGENPWIEIRFPGALTQRGDIGDSSAPLWDEAGAFMVDVYVPMGSGEEVADALGDAAWNIFKGQNFSGVRCDSRMAGQSGPREPMGDGGGVWWGLSFGISYRYLSID